MITTDTRRARRWTGVLIAAATLLSLTAQPVSPAHARQGIDLSSLPVVGGLLGGGGSPPPEPPDVRQGAESTPLIGIITGTIRADPVTGSFEVKVRDLYLSGRSRKYGKVTISLTEDTGAGRITGSPGNLHSELTLKLTITIEKPPPGVANVTYLGSVTFIATNWDAVPPTKAPGWTSGPVELPPGGPAQVSLRIGCMAPAQWKLPCNL